MCVSAPYYQHESSVAAHQFMMGGTTLPQPNPHASLFLMNNMPSSSAASQVANREATASVMLLPARLPLLESMFPTTRQHVTNMQSRLRVLVQSNAPAVLIYNTDLELL